MLCNWCARNGDLIWPRAPTSFDGSSDSSTMMFSLALGYTIRAPNVQMSTAVRPADHAELPLARRALVAASHARLPVADGAQDDGAERLMAEARTIMPGSVSSPVRRSSRSAATSCLTA